MIGCLLVTDFVAAIERRDAPSLARIPLVIVGGLAGSGKVLAVSGEVGGSAARSRVG